MSSWLLAAIGVAGAGLAVVVNAGAAGSAAAQAWPAFVLVAGLLLVGMVAAEDGLFAAAGAALRRVCPNRLVLFSGMAALIMAVSAVLNLDTAVAFLTPVAVSAGGRRADASLDTKDAPDTKDAQDKVVAALLPACILLANAGSLLLPGSNLTNLIVVTHARVAAGTFVSRMALPWLAVGLITTTAIAAFSRGALRGRPDAILSSTAGDGEDLRSATVTARRTGVGALAIAAAVAAMLAISSPSLVVAVIGLAAAAVRVLGRSLKPQRVVEVLNLPVLVGLMGLATAVGALGRLWSGPSTLLGHLDPLGTAVAAALSTVFFNNLPAASLLSARAVTHPFALMLGLDVGPNLFVSGSLAWVLWLSSSRACGVDPGLRRAVRIGLVAAPVATLAGVAALMLTS